MKFKDYLSEGGNARGTIKATGEDTLAQKIPIKKIGRTKFINKFIELFKNLNKRYYNEYKEYIWEDEKLLENGLVFNGSTSFIMDKEIPDDAVIPHKPTSGDIDIMIPKQTGVKLWYLLDKLENKQIIPDVIYKGMNKLKPTSIADEMNSVFEVKFDDIITYSQVDFELAEFKDNKPSEWNRFSHSSTLSDAQQGFKGVAHKYLIRALAGGASRRDDVVVITPKSTYEKYTIQKKKGEPLVPNFLKFSVDKGLRYAYEQQFTPDGKPWKIDNKFVYKEIPTKNSSYETSISNIFKILFNNPDSKDLDKMWSFVGIVDLVKKYLDKKQIKETFDRLLEILWGKSAQRLERDNPEIDLEVKSNIVNYLIKKISFLKSEDKKIQKMIDEFYKNYKTTKLSETFKGYIIENTFICNFIDEVIKNGIPEDYSEDELKDVSTLSCLEALVYRFTLIQQEISSEHAKNAYDQNVIIAKKYIWDLHKMRGYSSSQICYMIDLGFQQYYITPEKKLKGEVI